jgi:glycerol-3-phosphate dehydrogenase
MDRIRAICQPELGWDDARWAQEDAAYRTHWTLHHGLPHED